VTGTTAPPLARDAVVAAEVVLAAVPLERPVALRGTTIVDREYVVLRLRTDAGLEGAAIGYTRGLPVTRILNDLAPALLGADALGRVGIVARLEQGTASMPSSAAVRAVSLVDVALWDVAARHAGLPLWRLLGGSKPRVPVLAVGGYFSDQRTIEDVETELCGLAGRGFRHLKVHAHEPELVARLRAAVPDGVDFSVDADMRWRDLDDAVAACRRLDGLGLAFIEDPFPPDLPQLTRALADAIETPIAAGEDAAGRDALVELGSAADVLRVDATASGGIDAIVAAAGSAGAEGKTVITHAFVELHGQVAGGVQSISLAETIPYESGANPVDRLLAETQPIDDGALVLSDRPGHGLAFDWDAVARFARTTDTHDIERRNRCS
jgi:L-alanine-DL-glutamate epimerase-like enolase superfamily enzyme